MADAHMDGAWSVYRNRHNHWGMVEVDGPALTVRGFTSATNIDLAKALKVEQDAQLIAAAPDLLAASIAVLEMCEQHGDFRNGVTDPTGSIDEGEVIASRYFGTLKSAIAKATGIE